MMQRWGLLLAAGTILTAQQKPVDFQRDVRPILSDACYACHGPDPGTRMANLRLDVPGAAIVAGKPEESKAWKRITHANAALRMPPPQAHKVLSAEQKDILRRWIEQGAAYQEHWSFKPPQRPAEPVVGTRPGRAIPSTVSCSPAWSPKGSPRPPRPIAALSPAAFRSTSPACRLRPPKSTPSSPTSLPMPMSVWSTA
jgi:hypothetical protein